MNTRLRIEPEAEADIEQAFAWYESQRVGLGDEFLLSLEAVLAAADRSPESFPVVDHGLRRALMRRFPFGVFFTLEVESTIVLGVLHAKRDPTIWKQRRAR